MVESVKNHLKQTKENWEFSLISKENDDQKKNNALTYVHSYGLHAL